MKICSLQRCRMRKDITLLSAWTRFNIIDGRMAQHQQLLYTPVRVHVRAGSFLYICGVLPLSLSCALWLGWRLVWGFGLRCRDELNTPVTDMHKPGCSHVTAALQSFFCLFFLSLYACFFAHLLVNLLLITFVPLWRRWGSQSHQDTPGGN